MVAYFLNNFDHNITCFLSPHSSFSMCVKHSVIISKVQNESILFLKLIHNFHKITTKVYYNTDNEKIENFNV
jgi:hypothetical protein